MKRLRFHVVLTDAVELIRRLILTTLPFFCIMLSVVADAQTLNRETLATKIEPPNELGDQLSDNGIWSIRDRTGKGSGYIFETGILAPLPGFSGAPINVLVTLDRDGSCLSITSRSLCPGLEKLRFTNSCVSIMAYQSSIRLLWAYPMVLVTRTVQDRYIWMGSPRPLRQFVLHMNQSLLPVLL